MCFFLLSFFLHCLKHYWMFVSPLRTTILCANFLYFFFFFAFRSISFARIFFTYFPSVSFVLAVGLVCTSFSSLSSSSSAFFTVPSFFHRCCYQYWPGIIFPIIRGSEMRSKKRCIQIQKMTMRTRATYMATQLKQ